MGLGIWMVPQRLEAYQIAFFQRWHAHILHPELTLRANPGLSFVGIIGPPLLPCEVGLLSSCFTDEEAEAQRG